MITKFKIYESIDIGEPELGDYVICDESVEPILSDWLKANIGRAITTENRNGCIFDVYYDNEPPGNISFYFQGPKMFKLKERYYRPMRRDEILHWSKNKKDLDFFIDAIKYNL